MYPGSDAEVLDTGPEQWEARAEQALGDLHRVVTAAVESEAAEGRPIAMYGCRVVLE